MLHSCGTICNSRLGDDDPLLIVDYLSMNDNMAPAFSLQGRVRANVAGQSVENELIESQRVTTPTMNSGVVDLHSALGTVEINSPGAHTLTLEVATDLTGAKPKFRAVMLTPVTQDERR